MLALLAVTINSVKSQSLQERARQLQESGRTLDLKGNNPYQKSLTPLTDFGDKTYQGVRGGLYPNGENVRPKAHTEAGVAMAKSIQPLDRNGKVDEKGGKIVWLSIGMSNTTQETQRFLELMKDYPDKNPRLELIDGAFGQHAINEINDVKAPYWDNIVKQRLEPKGLSSEQVQVVWFKLAEIMPTDTVFASYTHALKEKYISTMQILKKKFPNLKIAYLTSRIYGGYNNGALNPEPFAWYTGWANKLVIEDQINGDPRLAYRGDDAKAPWISWGPYLWSNGTTPNAQGISWARSDLDGGGTHPSAAGRQKVAEALINFFSTDETAVIWFLKRHASVGMKGFQLDGDPVNGCTWSYVGTDDGVDYDIRGYIVKPAGNGPFPAILLSHGKDGSAPDFVRSYAARMASWNVVTIGVNYNHVSKPSGSPGSGREDWAASEANILRAKKCIDILRSLGYVDMKRVAAHGHSMGAYLTAALVSACPDLFLVASHTAGGIGEVGNHSFGTTREQAQKIKTPYLIIHGTKDQTVPVAEDRALIEILKNNGVDAKMIEIPEGSHKSVQLNQSDETLGYVKDFYEQHGLFK